MLGGTLFNSDDYRFEQMFDIQIKVSQFILIVTPRYLEELLERLGGRLLNLESSDEEALHSA